MSGYGEGVEPTEILVGILSLTLLEFSRSQAEVPSRSGLRQEEGYRRLEECCPVAYVVRLWLGGNSWWQEIYSPRAVHLLSAASLHLSLHSSIT